MKRVDAADSTERRDVMRRALMLRKVIAATVREPDAPLDIERVQQLAQVDAGVARRILQRLTCSGVVRPIGDDAFLPTQRRTPTSRG